MNLIEQLGGYEAAKSKCDRANKEGYLLLSVPVQNGFGDIYVYKVEAALLEYRRQHNIFEVGDKVIHETYAVHEIMDISPDGFCELSNFAYVHFSKLKHATDAEIEAGKRLEVV
ncbi:hypothetical protein [Acinetobacter sp.]|uniref:hypothetical protein n=1 Tax=Acinetobacter sp. TaxID=472 RepID=UPI002911F30F|nr:hypothetical protein [Acinetobacter sp.]MDU4032438.1 hypothetical protein [Acinetobacter sp.]